MILPSVSLLLLNSSTASNLTTRPKWIDGQSNAFCFFQTKLPDDPLLRTSYEQCYEAMTQITQGDKINAPIYFSRDPSLGFRLPHAWVHGTCVIEIDVHPTDKGDITTMTDIAKAAITISILCLEEWHHLGGRQNVGEKEVLNIVIYGRLAPEKRPRPRIGQVVNRRDRDPMRDTLEGG